MMQLAMFQPEFWSVSQITRHLRDLIEQDETLQDVWVQGEVSNLSRPSSGHLYFTVKDNNSSLRVIMWRNAVMSQRYVPREGEMVEIHGSINIYEISGVYQLYADMIRPVGVGQLYQEFLRLKARLEAEGLFDQQRKRPIPRWPQRIGLVTSPSGAAIRDILKTIHRRFPVVEVILAPTAVQGNDAPPGIVKAIEDLNRLVQPDVVILARGGGSIEDLWAFNDERVARAIAASAAPVITGVGHETDFTIADFVSDLRAPTPTGAAELATPNRDEILENLDDDHGRITRGMESLIATKQWELHRRMNLLAIRSPQNRLRSVRQHLDELVHSSRIAVDHLLVLRKTELGGLVYRLEALNPQSVLRRGYAILTLPTGQVVSHIAQAAPGTELKAQVSDGQFTVQVQET